MSRLDRGPCWALTERSSVAHLIVRPRVRKDNPKLLHESEALCGWTAIVSEAVLPASVGFCGRCRRRLAGLLEVAA